MRAVGLKLFRKKYNLRWWRRLAVLDEIVDRNFESRECELVQSDWIRCCHMLQNMHPRNVKANHTLIFPGTQTETLVKVIGFVAATCCKVGTLGTQN